MSTQTKDNSEKEVTADKKSPTQAQSFNDWEHADLGDDGRKAKFLRLMGAAKVISLNSSNQLFWNWRTIEC